MKTKKSISNFAKWYAYELHKFTFGNRKTEPTLKGFTKNNTIDVLQFLDKLFYLQSVLYSSVNDAKIKQAEQLRENLINDFSDHYLNNY